MRHDHRIVQQNIKQRQPLRQRLMARGRESQADIEERLARNARFTADLIAGNGAGLFVLDNSGPLENTVERLLCCLDHGHTACA